MSSKRQTQVIIGAAAAIASASLLYYFFSKSSSKKEEKKGTRSVGDFPSPTKGGAKKVDVDKTPLVKNGSGSGGTPTTDPHKELHATIEELDKKGKAFFKAKQVSVCLLLAQFSVPLSLSRRNCHGRASDDKGSDGIPLDFDTCNESLCLFLFHFKT